MTLRKLFGTDGVRALAGEFPLTEGAVRRLGLATGETFKKRYGGASRKILTVRDTRESGPWLLKALAAGLGRAGFQVMDGGVLPTPAVSVLAPREGFLAGAVISASHNPAEFNGIKFFGSDGTKLADSMEERIEAAFERLEDPPPSGSLIPYPAAAAKYAAYLKSTWPQGLSLKGFSLVVDCGHGAASRVAAGIFESLGARVHLMNARPNGRNINDHCGALYPQNLSPVVKKHKAHLGLAFDGDGDRAMFVDEEGIVRNGDDALLVAARHLKEQNRLKGNLVAVTVMANLGLRRAFEALGIETVETAVGDKYVWEALKKTGGVLGGEQSGHVIFREFLPSGDGLLTALQILAVMAHAGRPLSALASLAVRYPQVILNVPVKEKKPLASLAGFSRDVANAEKDLGSTGRVLVRYSGTEPLLRIMIEGADEESIRAHAQSLAESLKREGI